MGITAEFISDHRVIKRKVDQDAISIIEATVLKVSASGKIRDLYMRLRNPGNPIGVGAKRSKKLETNENLRANSRSGYLRRNRPSKCVAFRNAVGKAHFVAARSGRISEDGIPDTGKEIQ